MQIKSLISGIKLVIERVSAVIRSRRAEMDMSALTGHIKPKNEKCVSRSITVNGMKIHISSVFIGQTTLENALQNIVTRKLAEEKSI